MFEKDADIILSAHCDCELLTECLQGIRIRCSDYEEKKKLLLEGIEFGYQKANEWHYPSKGENLPKDKIRVYVQDVNGDYDIAFKLAGIWRGMSGNELRGIYAWKEIIPPKE